MHLSRPLPFHVGSARIPAPIHPFPALFQSLRSTDIIGQRNTRRRPGAVLLAVSLSLSLSLSLSNALRVVSFVRAVRSVRRNDSSSIIALVDDFSSSTPSIVFPSRECVARVLTARDSTLRALSRRARRSSKLKRSPLSVVDY